MTIQDLLAVAALVVAVLSWFQSKRSADAAQTGGEAAKASAEASKVSSDEAKNANELSRESLELQRAMLPNDGIAVKFNCWNVTPNQGGTQTLNLRLEVMNTGDRPVLISKIRSRCRELVGQDGGGIGLINASTSLDPKRIYEVNTAIAVSQIPWTLDVIVHTASQGDWLCTLTHVSPLEDPVPCNKCATHLPF